MIRGIGIDLVEIARMQGNVENEHFMHRVFSEAERGHIGMGNLAAERAAGNFAAKEALAKALGCGLAGSPLDCVEVLRRESGEPYLACKGKAEERMHLMGVSHAWVSITHTGGFAAAVVVLEGEDDA